MHLRSLLFSLTSAFALLSAAPAAVAAWVSVEADADLLEQLFTATLVDQQGRSGFTDAAGVDRFPGCSEGPTQAMAPANGSFRFFVDLGDHQSLAEVDDVLVYFGGGGACWEGATCIGSALTSGATYASQISETAAALNLASQADAGGILNTTRSDNPYAGFAKVYIPYCTGDVHIGSSDTWYSFTLPPEFGGQTLQWPIRHRGFDNLLVVLEWLQQNGAADAERLTVAGSSAGGYGALINFPVIREALGEKPDYSLIVDSSNGVLTDGFLDLAFGAPGSDGAWGIWSGETIAPLLQTILATAGADALWFNVFDAVGGAYRDTRISQSTTAYDIVQAIVLLNMKKVDAGTYTPFVRPDETEVALTALLDWSPKARAAMLTTAFSVPNYRYYLAQGQGHVHLIDPPLEALPFPTPNYFAENSARGVYYTDWLDDMLNNPRRFFGTDWKNLSCFPGCLQ